MNSARAFASRGRKKLAASAVGRRFVDARATVTEEDLLAGLTFAPASDGDLLKATRHIADEPDSVAKHFFDNADDTVKAVAEQFPEAMAATVASADAICRREFYFLGQRVAFEGDVDWHWCPETGGSWPVLPSGQYHGSISYFRDDRLGDIKYPWELNRHQYFVTLAKAWLHTGDEKYVRELTDQWLHWIEANPYRQGMNWASVMEVGIRLISWANALWLVRDSAYFQDKALRRVMTVMYQHARHLNGHLTTDWLVPTNHLIGETAALYTFGVLFPQFKESARWRERSLKIFAREIERQIWPDGVNKEQATGYHRFVADFVLLVVRLAELNQFKAPGVLRKRLEAMLDYERALLPPDNRVPQVGDCDDGRGYVLSEAADFFDYRGWQAVGAVMFDRNDFARAAGDGNDEALWFLGRDDFEQFRAMPKSPTPFKSRLFRDGGHAILRTGDDDTADYVFMRCGQFGLGGDGASSHAQGDMLAVVVYLNGLPLAIDSGTFAYYCDTDLHDWFRSVAVHNTVAPEGVEQAHMFRLKEWDIVPRTVVEDWSSEDCGGAVRAVMRAHERYVHERDVRLERHGLTISDHLDPAAGREYACCHWRLHLAPDLEAEVREDGLHITRAGAPFASLTYTGYDSAAVEDSWYSPSYGVRVPNKRVRLTAESGTVDGTVRIRYIGDGANL